MNISLNTFRRDELYDWRDSRCSSWHLYFQKINMIGDNKNLLDLACVGLNSN
jgi:hypothetical protein